MFSKEELERLTCWFEAYVHQEGLDSEDSKLRDKIDELIGDDDEDALTEADILKIIMGIEND